MGPTKKYSCHPPFPGEERGSETALLAQSGAAQMLPESVRFLASHVHLVNSIFGPEPAAADTTNALKTQAQKEGSAW